MNLAYKEIGGVAIIEAAENEQIESQIASLRAQCPERRIVVVADTPAPSWQNARAAFESGAVDYLTKVPRQRELDEISRRPLPPWQEGKAKPQTPTPRLCKGT